MFKDYEYGFYGFHCSISAYWMNSGVCQNQNYTDGRKKPHISKYTQQSQGTLKQLPKLKGVIFIYGNYKECI